MKYYAVQIAPRKEARFIEEAEQILTGRKYDQRFIFPKRQLVIRRHGKTLTEIQPLFPGYIFIEVENTIDNALYRIIRKTEYFYRFLKSNHDITPLQGHDLTILNHFIRLGETAGSSLVYFDNQDRIVVTEGPLKGLEGNIVKVDKRRRRAKIRLAFEDTPMTFDLAFDIISKELTKNEQQTSEK